MGTRDNKRINEKEEELKQEKDEKKEGEENEEKRTVGKITMEGQRFSLLWKSKL